LKTEELIRFLADYFYKIWKLLDKNKTYKNFKKTVQTFILRDELRKKCKFSKSNKTWLYFLCFFYESLLVYQNIPWTSYFYLEYNKLKRD
jgi:hypothetical protein